jgi:hypothetical protein
MGWLRDLLGSRDARVLENVLEDVHKLVAWIVAKVVETSWSARGSSQT